MTHAPATPLFVFIADTLRSEIAEGAYAPGSRLPSEAALAARFGVNRHTVRHGLRLLAEDGLVRSRRGSGTHVVGKPIDYRLGARVRFHQNLLDVGHVPEKKVLSVEVRKATPDDSRILKLPQGASVCFYEAVSYADGVPIAVAQSRFPEHRLPGLSTALKRKGSVTAALTEVGVLDYVRSSTRLSAERATAFLAVHLKLDQGEPVLHASSINVDNTGAVVEHGQTWFASTRVVLNIETGAFNA